MITINNRAIEPKRGLFTIIRVVSSAPFNRALKTDVNREMRNKPIPGEKNTRLLILFRVPIIIFFSHNVSFVRARAMLGARQTTEIA